MAYLIDQLCYFSIVLCDCRVDTKVSKIYTTKMDAQEVFNTGYIVAIKIYYNIVGRERGCAELYRAADDRQACFDRKICRVYYSIFHDSLQKTIEFAYDNPEVADPDKLQKIVDTLDLLEQSCPEMVLETIS